jgi:hypothetical protein
MVPISGGSYSIAKAQGLVPGPYRVMISSATQAATTVDPATGTPPPPGKSTPPPPELLPARYNTSTVLTAEVKEGTPNSFPFTLESKSRK